MVTTYGLPVALLFYLYRLDSTVYKSPCSFHVATNFQAARLLMDPS
jgi:hypothetical protein